MPFTGQNIYGSGIVNSRERSAQRMQEVRTGNWGRIDPERSPSARYNASRNSQREYLRSGQAFKGNFREKQADANQKSISGFLQRKQMIDQQG
jgi:hypothetical protein